MKKFVKIEDSNNEVIFLNPENVAAIQDGENGCSVFMAGGSRHELTEVTPEQLVCALEDMSDLEI